MPDSSIDRSVTLPEIPELNLLTGDKAVYDYLKSLHVAIAAFYDNLAERINQFLVLQDWQSSTHPQFTSQQDNFNLSDGVVHRFSTSGPQTITGFLAPQVGRMVVCLNEGPDALTIANQSVSSSPDNRVINTAGVGLVLSAGQTAAFWYDTDLAVKRWRQLSL